MNSDSVTIYSLTMVPCFTQYTNMAISTFQIRKHICGFEIIIVTSEIKVSPVRSEVRSRLAGQQTHDEVIVVVISTVSVSLGATQYCLLRRSPAPTFALSRILALH
jgi:hypothetical protein